MSVSYASNIYTKDRLFFLKLLFRWTGSVWEMIWLDYLFFVMSYVILAVIYHQALAGHEHRQLTFEAVVRWLSKIRTSVPLSFMLGFFVSTVFSRWWSTCMSIPWMNSTSFYVQALVESTHPVKSDIARKIRISVLRYFNLSWILMMATISPQIKDRFGFRRPDKVRSKAKSADGIEGIGDTNGSDSTDARQKPEFELTWRERINLINSDEKVLKHFGQLVTADEVEAFARSAVLSHDTDLVYSPEFWLPLTWATRLMRRAKTLGLIVKERELLFLVEMANRFRGDLATVWAYSEFTVPLVYTQVAVAAVYLFLFSTLLSTQVTRSEMVTQGTPIPAIPACGNRSNLTRMPGAGADGSDDPVLGVELLSYFPILGSLEFIFYLGWFKIGIVLMNPLGKDRADLPLSDILNSNLKSSVKMGGAEDSLYPQGLTDNGETVEQQVSQLLGSFDFSQVHAHDNFTSAEEVEAHLRKHLLRRLQGTGKDIVHTLDFLQLRNAGRKKHPKKAAFGDTLDRTGPAVASSSGTEAAAAAAAALAGSGSDSLTSVDGAALAARVLAGVWPNHESIPLLSDNGDGGGGVGGSGGGGTAEEVV